MKDLIELNETIKKNIIMDEGFEFKRLEERVVIHNKKEYECFYIVTCKEQYELELYICITPDFDKSIQNHVFKNNGILNDVEIINIINSYFNINIKLSNFNK